METTLTLRNRLGFNEVTLWKQFCSRRLHLIHTLSLSLRKASEQEEQVRVLAAELCAEYGFDPSAQADFEKLLIAGIQSVRRNQKRSARNPNGPTSETSTSSQSSSQRTSPTLQSRQQEIDTVEFQVPHTSNGPTLVRNRSDHLPPGSAGDHRPSTSPHQLNQANESPVHQSLAARLDVLRSMVGAGSAMWIESNAPEVAQLSAHGALSTAVATAAVHAKLSFNETRAMRDFITQGPLLEALRIALDPQLTTSRLMERLGALGASLVHGPHLFSALQALCVCLAQSSSGVPEQMCKLLAPSTPYEMLVQYSRTQLQHPQAQAPGHIQPPMHYYAVPAFMPAPPPPAHLHIQPVPSYSQVSNDTGITTPTSGGMPPPPVSHPSPPTSAPANDLLPYAISRIPTPRQSSNTPQEDTKNNVDNMLLMNQGDISQYKGNLQFSVPDRFVTLEYNGKILKMTYSPMKASPPTLSEIIETGRSMFSIPPSTVARVKDLQSKKIIETNSELIDAFSQPQVKLELFLPPPMLVGMPQPKPPTFTPLAPVFVHATEK